MQTTQVDGWFFAEAAKSFLTLRCKDDLRKLWSRAKQYTAQHPSNPPILDVRPCNSFLHAFLIFGDDDGLQEVLGWMQQEQIQKNYLTYALQMDVYVREGNSREAEDMFHQNLSLDVLAMRPEAGYFTDMQLVWAHNTYFMLLAGQERWDEVETAIREPLSRWNGDGLLKMEAVVQARRESGKPVCAVMYYVLIIGYAERGQLEAAQRTMDEALAQRPVERMVVEAVKRAELAIGERWGVGGSLSPPESGGRGGSIG
eukprot:EG_transcript_22721